MAEYVSDSSFGVAIKTTFEKGGIGAVIEYVVFNLDQWKSATISIAVIGRSGVGKSTFINAFRNVKDDGLGSAKTGATETTTEIKSYQDPTNPNIQLFDLPGVGTKRFPKNEYLERILVDRFDIFLLMTATLFTENDAWIAGELMAKNKPFFFVRTQVWNDVLNTNQNLSVKIPDEQIINDIRHNCKEKNENKDAKIFLIDSFKEKHEKLDFTKLRIAMSESLPELKEQALLHAFRDFAMLTPTLIEKKGKVLRDRIWKVALLSGTGGLIPTPGISYLVDLSLVQKERNFYANELGIIKSEFINGVTTGTIKSLSERSFNKSTAIFERWGKDLPVHKVSEIANASIPFIGSIVAGIKPYLRSIPIIGSIAAGIRSYYGTILILNKMLDDMMEDALKVNVLFRNELVAKL